MNTILAEAPRTGSRPGMGSQAVASGQVNRRTRPLVQKPRHRRRRPRPAIQPVPDLVVNAPAVTRPEIVTTPAPPVLPVWLLSQGMNIERHERALRPFIREEFGGGDVAPSESHIRTVNELVGKLRAGLSLRTQALLEAVRAAVRNPTPENLSRATELKQAGHNAVMATEKVWDFYFELFGQRQTQFAPWLLSCDRIGRDCYQAAFVRVGVARSLPSPPPFSYVRTGFSPATYTRHIRLSKIGRQINPFPLIQLPYHRLVNPWTLGAVLHEVSHNLQNDLGLQLAIPRAVLRRLLGAGAPPAVARQYARWNREIFADLSGLLLGGPEVVGSLMDVVGRSTASVLGFNPEGVHPTPYLRVFLSLELLRRLGFPNEAARYEKAWTALYPHPQAGTLPPPMLHRFRAVIALVVDTICFQPFEALGNRPYSEVIPFHPRHQAFVEEAAGRLGQGIDPGIIPARFLIGATRIALERKLASPQTIQENFYKELSTR